MKRRKLLLSTILAVLLGSLLLAVLFFTVPVVVFVEPEVPELFSSRLLPKAGVGEGFLLLPMKEGSLKQLSAIRKPNLVVYSPLSNPNEAFGKSLQWGVSSSNAAIMVKLSEEKMWQDALSSLGDRPIAILYNLFDSKKKAFVARLQEEYPNLQGVTYEGFINTYMMEDLKSQLDPFYAVLVISPEEASDVYPITSSRIVLDFRYAASAVTLDRVISVTPDWNKIIKEALSMESGEISPDYTITVLSK